MTRKEQIQAELEELNKPSFYVLWSSGEFEYQCYPDPRYIKQGNVFPSREAAERERDRRALIKELRDRAGGYKPVWDGETTNYCLSHNYEDGWFWDFFNGNDLCPRSGYFKAPIKGLIEEFGDRLNLLRDL